MKNLDLTKLDVKKLNKKQMSEINGGQIGYYNDDYSNARDIAYTLYETHNTGLKGISLIDAFTKGFNSAK